MVTITGSGANDVIDVTNDDGTLNGTPQGNPVDDIRSRNGNDTITVTDSTISGAIRAGKGSDTITVSGSTVGDIRLGNGNDTLNFKSTNVTGDVRGGGGSDALNLPTGTVVTDSTYGTFTVTNGGSYSLSSGSFTLPSGIVVSYTTFESGTGFPCFMGDTRIQTVDGLRKVQDLRVGDEIPTQEHPAQKIRWIGHRTFGADDLAENPKLRPIKIVAGALGNGLPHRDMWVSRQHRMLLNSVIAKRMFGRSDVLVAAIKLTEMPGIFIDETVSDVEYFHLLFDRHEVIYAEGAPTESLYTGPEALNALGRDARTEIMTIFPELINLNYTPKPVRFIPPGKFQKKLINRHLKNNKSLICEH